MEIKRGRLPNRAPALLMPPAGWELRQLLPRSISRPAAIASSQVRTLSIVGYIGMVGGLLGLFAMRGLFSSSPLVISLQAVALLLFLWARATFGWRSFHVRADPTEGGLVTGGPYRCIRHPIYAAMCLFAGAGVAGNWAWSAGLCGALIVGSAMTRILCEEALLTLRYPEYAQYKAKTWRMIPLVY